MVWLGLVCFCVGFVLLFDVFSSVLECFVVECFVVFLSDVFFEWFG